MKKICLIMAFVLMMSCTLVSCGNAETKDAKDKKNEIVDAEETPALRVAQNVINGLYGEDSYRYEEIENQFLADAGDDFDALDWYSELTFYQVYKDNKEFCKIAVETKRMLVGVKTPEMDTYIIVKFGPGGADAHLTNMDLQIYGR